MEKKIPEKNTVKIAETCKLSASVVLYNTPESDVVNIITSFAAAAGNNKIFLVDNSQKNSASIYAGYDKVEYIHSPVNVGYGAAHNIAMRKSLAAGYQYHFILNPDVQFHSNAIGEMYNFLESHKDIGLLMPKIIYPNGATQYLCKLLPTPADLFARRFLPEKIMHKSQDKFELRAAGYDKIMEVPFLSGCFMALRREAIQVCGMFDERFFMYGEDIDFSRRIRSKFKTVFYPQVSIVHGYEAASYKSFKMLVIHTVNIIRYFNKWGWFFDAERKRINAETLQALQQHQQIF